MPTTTNFGWTTPADTDLVKDGAAAIRTLGNGIDTSLVDLKGGTTGQVLSKNSNTDLDYTWVTPNVGDITEVQAGTGISVASGTGPIPVVTNSMATEITAKGDLIVGTGSGTFDNLAVGTNGYTLVADSSTATGLKWAAAGASLVGCKVTKAAGTPQTISNNTGTVITWTVEDFDTDSFHDNSTNTSRITIPSGKGGKYLVNANCFWASNNTGVRLHEILLNGGSYARANFPAVSGENACCTLTTIGTFAAGDYLEVYVKQNSGGNLDFSELYTSFSCIYLGA